MICCLCPEVSCSLISRGFLPALCLITTIRVTEYKIQVSFALRIPLNSELRVSSLFIVFGFFSLLLICKLKCVFSCRISYVQLLCQFIIE
ncbi:hypothetical protein HanHA300_Chr12g0462721 [Helianthus annuus]|nr:hypothetical protein HanHA300_Chr12g0462721 [Helianthus annuus]KAJ0676615.1 hypothetical protein HanLR1_Chr12g0464761 [Helianthus annuus]KAJ0679819.1 hypothetical protein HanOQP8_Chr12g0463921 [Helianthus annuus]